MKYESDTRYDHGTNRVLECPRCKNENFSEGALFCRICGLDLVNTCIPEPAEDMRGEYYTPEPHENPPDARFCEQCGAPTVYYQKHEILMGYEVVLEGLSGGSAEEGESIVPF